MAFVANTFKKWRNLTPKLWTGNNLNQDNFQLDPRDKSQGRDPKVNALCCLL